MSTETRSKLIIDNVEFEITSGKSVNNKTVPAVIKIVDVKNPQTLDAFKKVAEAQGFTGNITRGVKSFENGVETDKFFSIDLWEKNSVKAEVNPVVALAEKLDALLTKYASETNPILQAALIKTIEAVSAEIDRLNAGGQSQPVKVTPPTVVATPVAVPAWGSAT
jgi:hypothetical protein